VDTHKILEQNYPRQNVQTVEQRSNLTKATALIILIVVASVFAIGIEKVFGEEVIVDLPEIYDAASKLCNEGSATAEWWCNWKHKANQSGYTGNQTTVESGDYEWNDETKTYEPTAEFQAEAKADCKESLTCPSGNYQFTNGTIVDFDDFIELSQPTPFVLPEESFRYVCANDIALYQDGYQFEAPFEIWIDKDGKKNVRLLDDNSVEADNKTTPDELAVEACFAQWNLEIRDNIAVRTIVTGEDDRQIYHAEAAYGETPKSQAFVNDLANKDRDSNLSIHNLICNGYYEHIYKKAMGCFTEFPESFREIPTANDVFSEELKAKIEQYNSDDGVQMAKELQRQQIYDKFNSLQNQLRALE